MPVLITSDLHFSDNPRDRYRFDFVDWLVETAHKHECHAIWILGDITEEKDRHSAHLVNEICQQFLKLEDFSVKILQGNHDAIDPSMPFFKFLGDLTAMEWIGSPSVYNDPELGEVLFLPHTRDHKKDWKGLDFKSPNAIFAHNTFAGTKSESGMDLDGVPPSIFPKRSNVISGDIHSPQKVGPVEYVGAPYTVDFGDNYKGRVLVLGYDDCDGLQQLSIPYKGPQKRLIEGHVEGKSTPVISDGNVRNGDLVKVRLAVTAEQYYNWSEIKRKTIAIGEKGRYVVYMVQPNTEKVKGTVQQKQKKEYRSDDEVIAAYAKLQKLDEHTVKVGTKIIERKG